MRQGRCGIPEIERGRPGLYQRVLILLDRHAVEFKAMVEAGASRIGASAGVRIAQETRAGTAPAVSAS